MAAAIRGSRVARPAGTATAKEDRIGLAATCGVGDLSSYARRAMRAMRSERRAAILTNIDCKIPVIAVKQLVPGHSAKCLERFPAGGFEVHRFYPLIIAACRARIGHVEEVARHVVV